MSALPGNNAPCAGQRLDPTSAARAASTRARPAHPFAGSQPTSLRTADGDQWVKGGSHPLYFGKESDRYHARIFDDMDTPVVAVDFKRQLMASHGLTTQRIIEMLNPNVDVEPTHVVLDDPKVSSVPELTKFLKQALADKEAGKHVDAINISAGNQFNMRVLSAIASAPITGLIITPENLFTHKREVKKGLREQSEKLTFLQDYVEQIDLLEKLASLGVEIFIAAGNDGPGTMNILALADNVHVVGNLNAKGQVMGQSSETTAVTDYARGTYTLVEKTAPTGEVVFDALGNGTPLFSLSEWGKRRGLSESRRHLSHPSETAIAPADTDHANPFRLHYVTDDFLKTKIKDDNRLLSAEEITERVPQYKAQFHISDGDLVNWNLTRHVLDEQGTVHPDYDRSGRLNATGYVAGTSFAAPAALAEFFLEKKTKQSLSA
jgi:hypothetical protein